MRLTVCICGYAPDASQLSFLEKGVPSCIPWPSYPYRCHLNMKVIPPHLLLFLAVLR